MFNPPPTAPTPGEHDVLFGRGNAINKHPGNRRLRDMVERQRPAFVAAKLRKDKRQIARNIVQDIHSLDPPGRFLMEDRQNGGGRNDSEALVATGGVHRAILNRNWAFVEPDRALAKVMHRLREKEKGAAAVGDDESETRKLKQFDESENSARHLPFNEMAEFCEVSDDAETLNASGANTPPDSVPLEKHPNNAQPVPQIHLPLHGPTKNETHSETSYINVDGLGEEFDSFMLDFGPRSKTSEGEIQLREYTLREWIERLKKMTLESYLRSALWVALKLTESIIDGETYELRADGRPISLASITGCNVIIREKEFDSTSGSVNASEVKLDNAWIMSCIGDDDDVRGVMPRLAALGAVFYELFSGHEVPKVEASSNLLLIKSTNLNESASNDRPKKKNQKQSTHGDLYFECVSNLESMGVPQSLCALVSNLLDCSNGDFCGEDAFTSFADVRVDLQLMANDPSRYLENIQTNPLPTLAICDKLYGREDELKRVEKYYQDHIHRSCGGVMIKGAGGVGKSKLGMHVQELTIREDGYFLVVKFDQNHNVNPLLEIGSLFNSLCEMFAQDATPSQLKSVDDALYGALGNQAALIAGVIPSLKTIMPSYTANETSTKCVDSAASMRYLFGKLLSTLAAHSKPISIYIDDIQWADSTSLVLIESLISGVERVFFTCCYRDDEPNLSLKVIEGFSLPQIKLENMTCEDVNMLVSETLHLSTRLTRPLSTVLHHKTRGSPLFLRKLIRTLELDGHIFVNLSYPRWDWNLDKIIELEISDDILLLMINEMQMLPDELQSSLKILSCIGSVVSQPVLDVLSLNLDANMQIQIQQLSQKGFVYNIKDVSSFRFSHDKIQQAARELMQQEERLKVHMQVGLAIISHVLGTDPENELFFIGINQINWGGPDVLPDSNKRSLIAALNLKAGKRAVAFSDFQAALKLFESGVSFLPEDAWNMHYDLALELCDAAAHAACTIHNREKVTFYANQVTNHAQSFEDKLNCLYSASRVLRQSNLVQESKQSMFNLILQCGEKIPQPVDNKEHVLKDMQVMNDALQVRSDESILNAEETKDKKIVVLQKVYAGLASISTFREPSLLGAVSIRMVDLTLKLGQTCVCPLAFSHYGGFLVSMGKVTEGCRLGRIALKLLEKSYCAVHKSSTICITYFTILWTSEPFQSVAEWHMLGYRAGMQSGDFMSSLLNERLAYNTNYVSGKCLSTVRKQFRHFIPKMHRRFFVARSHSILYHLHAVALQDGEERLKEDCVDGAPGLREALDTSEKTDKAIKLVANNFHVQRLFFFHRFDEITLSMINITADKSTENCKPFLLMGIFYQGLISYQCARQTSNETTMKWVEKGNSALATMRFWKNHCPWNFENKVLLLEAEKAYVLGEFDQAEDLYTRSIRSAYHHKFVHEQAVASEMAGAFFHERNLTMKSLAFFKLAVKCYEEWGAAAVARRLESSMQQRFGLSNDQFDFDDNISLEYIFDSREGTTKKRLNIF